MRRVLMATLFAAFVGVMLVLPATAQELHGCQMETTISAVRACVEHAHAEGLIDNQGIANSLLMKLTVAQAALDRGDTPAAINALQAFARETTAQAGKHI